MEVPTGAIPYIENQWSHHEFVTAVQPQYALVKITTARALHDEYGETADSYYGEDTKVITTTTITDSALNLLSWEKEFDIVRDFDPAFHIPCDYSTYEDADQEERTENVSNYLEGTITMQRWLREADSEIQILPLIKGVTDSERDRAIATLEPYAFPGYVFYGTQYYTSGDGILIDELVADVTATARGHTRPLFLIGCLSPNHLQLMPQQVVAGSGVQRWRMHIKPRKQDAAEMREAWNGLCTEVSNALGTPLETHAEPQPSNGHGSVKDEDEGEGEGEGETVENEKLDTQQLGSATDSTTTDSQSDTPSSTFDGSDTESEAGD